MGQVMKGQARNVSHIYTPLYRNFSFVILGSLDILVNIRRMLLNYILSINDSSISTTRQHTPTDILTTTLHMHLNGKIHLETCSSCANSAPTNMISKPKAIRYHPSSSTVATLFNITTYAMNRVSSLSLEEALLPCTKQGT